ncbi:bifunctional biotin--[acetyl-CoA-carboxylase] ligase/biotin operon repressor BirA [Thalassotalea fusca]
MASSIRERLIEQLAAGQFVSGQVIGETLGISRAAISKHIKALEEMGIDVFRVTGKGYRLAEPLQLLDKQIIANYCASVCSANKIEVHSVIDSTNTFLLRRIPNQVQKGQVCVAEFQSAGRGRRGRTWVSPFGSHIYFSLYWYLEQGMAAAMGLNVVVALAISDAIQNLYQLNAQLKWPNDIYLNDRKLAGILIELEGQALEPCHSVIGIGLNVNMPEQMAEKIDQPWSDIQSHVNQSVDRNELVGELIKCLNKRLLAHEESGISSMVNDWLQRDKYLNQRVTLISGTKETTGICRGINAQGALLLEQQGAVKPIYGGEISLRPAQ